MNAEIEELQKKPFEELTSDELKLLTKAKREAEAKQEATRKQKYVKLREEVIQMLISKSEEIEDDLKDFKKFAFVQLDDFYKKMIEYGEVSENNKGSFSLKSEDGNMKVEYAVQMTKEFNELADLASDHMRNFLSSYVKKKDLHTYELILGLLEKKGKNNSFDIALIGRLFQMEHKFTDPEWKKAIDLFREAYVETNSAKYIRFYKRNETGQWQNINLNLASV